jgi:flagellar biosynthesis protein FliQ
MMTGPEVLDVARDGIITYFKVGMPIMIIGLAIGFAVSVFQALTQIQEQTLVYVPKIVSTFLGLLILMPFMSDALQGYMMRVTARIIAGG